MIYKTLGEIIADIGKPNITSKHLIQAAFDFGVAESACHCSCLEDGEAEVEEAEVEEEELDIPTLT